MDSPNGNADAMCADSHVPMWVAKLLAAAIGTMMVVIILTVAT